MAIPHIQPLFIIVNNSVRGQSFGRSSANPMQSSMASGYGTKKSGRMGMSGGGFNPQASSVGGMSFGGSGNFKSTVPMNFRGQDKSRDQTIGSNPNANVEDEYISNLQQQIHFMELELKILKEKVVDDEKNSGIGSLFDDEKTSYQHISMLKEKYKKMRRDYDKTLEDLNKYKLEVIGDQFILDSQVNVLMQQNLKMEETQKEYDYHTKKRHFELEREFKDLSKQRYDLENQLRQLEHDTLKEVEENYINKMTIIKDQQFDELGNSRHQKESELNDALIEEKDEEIAKYKQERENVQQHFNQNQELQRSYEEAQRLKEQIEEANVKLELLQIQVCELQDSSDFLNNKKEELVEARKMSELKNDELKKELAAKEEIAAKRLQAKLSRDKNIEVKELLAQEETAQQHNTELSTKLTEEMKKFEQLLEEKLEIEQKLEVVNGNLEAVQKKVDEQTELLGQLKDKIQDQSSVVEELSAKVDEEKKVNKVEEEKHRKLTQTNAHLKAKLQFIQTKYDYSANVNKLNSDDFKTLVTSNDMVNMTVKDFVSRLDQVKEDAQRFEALKYSFQ